MISTTIEIRWQGKNLNNKGKSRTCPSFCLSVCLWVWLSIRNLDVCLSEHQEKISICPSVWVWLSIRNLDVRMSEQQEFGYLGMGVPEGRAKRPALAWPFGEYTYYIICSLLYGSHWQGSAAFVIEVEYRNRSWILGQLDAFGNNILTILICCADMLIFCPQCID